MSSCIICQKEQNPAAYVGAFIAQQSGLTLSHFPFLSDESATRGHLIIEPSRHVEDISELSATEIAALGPLIQLGTGLILHECGAEHVYCFRINDKVKHLHFHLVPRYPGTPAEWWGLKIMAYPDRPMLGSLAEIQTLSEKLKSSVR